MGNINEGGFAASASQRCLSEFDALSARLNKAASKEEVTHIHAEWKPFKQALQDLCTMAKGAHGRCEQSLKRLDALKGSEMKRKSDQEAAEGELARKKRKTIVKLEGSIWDHLRSGVPCSSPIDILRVNVEAKVVGGAVPDLSEPVIFRLDRSEMLKIVKIEVELLQREFQTNEQRTVKGQAVKEMPPAAAELVSDFLFSLLKDKIVAKTALQSWKWFDRIQPTLFARAAQKETVAYEAAMLPTLRLTAVGCKEVLLLHGMSFLEFLQQKSPVKAMPDTKEAVSALKSLKKEDLAEFHKSKSSVVRTATVGPLDCLCIPAGWLFWEKTLNSDSFGVRLQYLRAADLDGLERFKNYLQTKRKGNEMLESAVDFLTLHEG